MSYLKFYSNNQTGLKISFMYDFIIFLNFKV